MKTLIAFVVAFALAAVAFAASETCFSKGESVDGLNKICLYSCASGDAAITVKSYQLCPITIKR